MVILLICISVMLGVTTVVFRTATLALCHYLTIHGIKPSESEIRECTRYAAKHFFKGA